MSVVAELLRLMAEGHGSQRVQAAKILLTAMEKKT